MTKITLNRAFIIRSRILKKIGELSSKVTYTKPIFEKGQENKNFDFNKIIDEIILLRKSLVELNNAIDIANASGPRQVINEIEACKQNIKMAQNAQSNTKGFQSEVKKWDSGLYNEKTQNLGDYVIVEYTLCAHPEEYWIDLEESERARLMELEDKLAELNNSTMVEIPNA